MLGYREACTVEAVDLENKSILPGELVKIGCVHSSSGCASSS